MQEQQKRQRVSQPSGTPKRRSIRDLIVVGVVAVLALSASMVCCGLMKMDTQIRVLR